MTILPHLGDPKSGSLPRGAAPADAESPETRWEAPQPAPDTDAVNPAGEREPSAQELFFEEDTDESTPLMEIADFSQETEEKFDLKAQLAALDGVSDDMGTVALGNTTFRETQPLASSSLRIEDWSQWTDAEIMQRAGLGDDACLEYLVTKYRRPIVYFMYRMVRNQAVAEELAQEVFLRVYRSRQSYRAEARFSTWLYRIASNLAVNHARDTKQERSASTIYLDAADEETGTSPDVADGHLSAEQDLLQQERVRQIRAHVLALPERQKMAVLMHKYQELNYKEIGAVLKLSESATKSLLFRAYQTLREGLKDFV